MQINLVAASLWKDNLFMWHSGHDRRVELGKNREKEHQQKIIITVHNKYNGVGHIAIHTTSLYRILPTQVRWTGAKTKSYQREAEFIPGSNTSAYLTQADRTRR